MQPDDDRPECVIAGPIDVGPKFQAVFDPHGRGGFRELRFFRQCLGYQARAERKQQGPAAAESLAGMVSPFQKDEGQRIKDKVRSPSCFVLCPSPAAVVASAGRGARRELTAKSVKPFAVPSDRPWHLWPCVSAPHSVPFGHRLWPTPHRRRRTDPGARPLQSRSRQSLPLFAGRA